MPALQIKSDQRAALRADAHALKPVVIVGAEGLTDAVLKEIEVHLSAHQLIKIRVFGDERDERIAVYDEICDRLDAAPIQHIGKLLVIWKPEVEEVRKPSARGAKSRTAIPSVREAAAEAPKKGAAPRVVKVVKPSENPMRRPKPQKVVVRGNERVTAGGNVKRAKKRQTSAKRQHQSSK
ncbi:YhbY family RNA-binding protein [Paraburkholderia phosphatilytica]|uniref:YhbY family RNA-binding protein n=1 Tax=Paraburkholderia phosphatilytica TaxID=2282883 RepID=UPI000E4D1F09|nr:YhbY family RNA-binding protein [Paraburkholderia phosphatilytica]